MNITNKIHIGDDNMPLIYDPKTNIIQDIDYDLLSAITGKDKSNLMTYRSKGKKITNINCYILPTGYNRDNSLKLRYEWYANETYEGEYWLSYNTHVKVSNYGRVKRIYKKSERYALPFLRKGQGNLLVKIKINNRSMEVKVSKLVAHCFIRPKKDDEFVLHKNGIITDDHASNLEYVDRVTLGKRTGHKATSKTIIMLDAKTNKVLNEFRSSREAARNVPYSYQAILDRCHGVYKQSDGVIFKFGDMA